MIRPIALRNLAATPTRQVAVVIDENLESLETLTPVQGEVTVTHRGDFLEVEGHAQTIVTLQCDRCLGSFNYRLEANFDEIIWLDHEAEVMKGEQEIAVMNLEEHLDADGELDLLDLVYQHLCLEVPMRKLCEADCAGILPVEKKSEKVDDRWAALSKLREDFS
jgi:uncharacterized protein